MTNETVAQKQEAQLSLGWADPWPTVLPVSEGQRLTYGRRINATAQSNYSFLHAMATLLYRTLQSTLRYDTVIRRTWLMAAGSNFALKIVTKPLHIKTWLLMIQKLVIVLFNGAIADPPRRTI